MAADMNDIRLEKSVEVVYDQIIVVVPVHKRKTCPVVIKLAQILDSMKNENNRNLAIELGVIGDCERCDSRCK